jgi:large subunit ribosomal protein LP0
MEVLKVYDDGSMLDKSVIDFDLSTLLESFQRGVKNLTALSLETGIVTATSVPHIIVNAFKNLAAISVETGYKLAALEAA